MIETGPCKLCATETDNLGTELCNRCWELSRRIEADPDLASCLTISRIAERSGFDVSPCSACEFPIVCVPDGLPFCSICAAKEES